MAWFEDLTPYRYLGDEADALNVGWLEPPHSFPTGEAGPDFVRKLVQLCVEQHMNATCGWQECRYCPHVPWDAGGVNPFYPVRIQYEGAGRALGDAEIRVRHPNGSVFAAPDMVAHYVAEHRYLPPEAFIEAVLADPRTFRTDTKGDAQ
jgi:hypothetical protein